LEPRHDYARERLLGLLAARGRHGEAVAGYEQAGADRPDEPRVGDGRAGLCRSAGRTGDYDRVCDGVMERFGSASHPRACELAARVSLLLPPDAAGLQRATALIERAIAGEPAARAQGPVHLFHLTRALARYRAGRFDEAIRG